MPIPGVTFEEITNAFETAYERDDLKEMLRKRMSEKLDNITGPNTKLSTAVFDLVSWSERHGRTTELIRAGYNFIPTQPAMQAIYEKYGMAVEAVLQQGGTEPSTVKVTALGFEKTIKSRLPLLDFSVWRTKMTQVEGQVCRVEIDGNAAGTGFLVGPDAVLTNYHVLKDVLAGNTNPEKVAFRFDYKVLANGSRVEGVVVAPHSTAWNLDSSSFSPAEETRNPDTPAPTADQLDYALVQLARRVGEESFAPNGRDQTGAQLRGWLALPAGPLAFAKDDPLMIVQHPDGSPMKLAVDTESVVGEVANGLRVRYRTNTEPGSSGSPVFDLNWNLVALHHMGDPASSLPATYNQGVPLDKVRARIVSQGKSNSLGAAR
jgi:V8-like Glu-specific endopeptidase